MIREFFRLRGVLEVETPLLQAATSPTPHIDSLAVETTDGTRWLQPSPEFAMKRMLADGCGPVYQICKAFRSGERGTHHNPEFTLLEWYRPAFDEHDLMDEVDDLLEATLASEKAERRSYGSVFEERLAIDPHRAEPSQLRRTAVEHGLQAPEGLDRDDWLDLLLSHLIAPDLGRERPLFIYDYPASQACLARIRQEDPPVAERFEVWIDGIEIANGFHELTDAEEQGKRFEAENEQRERLGKAIVPVDERLLAALRSGLPPTAGVALGIDRLLILRSGHRDLDDVLAFPWDRA